MSNKKTIKEVFESEFDINKNYKKIITKIEGEKNMKFNNILKYSLMPVCLLILFGYVMLFNNKPNNILTTVNGNNIVINQQNYKDNSYKSYADIKMSKDDTIFTMYSVKNQLNIPNNLELTDSFCIYVKDYNGSSKEEYMNIKEYNKLSGCNLIYSNGVKSINIALAKGHAPLRDYEFNNENLNSSKINDVETIIVKYENYYWATFSNNNIYYDIETSDINITELVDLITSLIK